LLRLWLNRNLRAQLAQRDAADLLDRFGDRAYEEARRRIHEEREGKVIDQNRPKGHCGTVRVLLKERYTAPI
jgi:hypothetical protein